MRDKKIAITQTGDRFTMELIEDGRRSVLANNESHADLNYRWWLNPMIFDLAEELRTWDCSDAQIRQAYVSLLSGRDTHIELDLPTD
jgi:hypothetical protein